MELKELIRKYSEILKDLEYSKYQMNLALRKGNKGKYQSLSLHIKYLKRKLSGISRSLKNLIHGTRTDVKFQLGSDLYEASFNNLSEQDIRDVLEIISISNPISNPISNQEELKILEIKENQTYIRKL
nr:MAG: hypothetical protein [Bacteriophage sp.]